MGKCIPTNVEIGSFLRELRKSRLNLPIEDVALTLGSMITPERGPSQALSKSGLQRREAGKTDLELSTFLMVLLKAGVRMRLIEEDGQPLPPELQLYEVNDRPPQGSDFLEMATNLQREVDRLVTMAELVSLKESLARGEDARDDEVPA